MEEPKKKRKPANRDVITRGPNKRHILRLRSPRPTKTTLRNNWRLAQASQVFLSFTDLFDNFPYVTVDALEHDLLGDNNPPVILEFIIIYLAKFLQLMREPTLDKVAAATGATVAWSGLTVFEKIGVLHWLVVAALRSPKFRKIWDERKTLEPRISPIAADGANKYYLLDNNRIYLQSGVWWQCIAWNLETWKSVVEDLEKKSQENKKNRAAQKLHKYFSSLLPVIEHNETMDLKARQQHERAERKRLQLEQAMANRKQSRRLAHLRESTPDLP